MSGGGGTPPPATGQTRELANGLDRRKCSNKKIFDWIIRLLQARVAVFTPRFTPRIRPLQYCSLSQMPTHPSGGTKRDSMKRHVFSGHATESKQVGRGCSPQNALDVSQ